MIAGMAEYEIIILYFETSLFYVYVYMFKQPIIGAFKFYVSIDRMRVAIHVTLLLLLQKTTHSSID